MINKILYILLTAIFLSLALNSKAQTVVDTISSVSGNDSLKIKKRQALDAEVQYSAKDSIVFFADGVGIMYGNGDVKYMEAKPMEITAEYIRYKMDSSTVMAIGGVDTTGAAVGNPVFKDGKDEYKSKFMDYNFKTKKGYIRGGITEQGDAHIIADKTKKDADNNLFVKDGMYTTCDLEHPHYYLDLTRAKVKPGHYIATGPAYLVMEDVPLPIGVPFGFFPFTNKYSSGFIMPTYGDELERGFNLRNGGYYFAFNDYFDLALTGDIYTKGTWAVNLASSYVKRYKFRGSVNVSYRDDVTGLKGTSTYASSRNFKVAWTHSQDAKANLYHKFSASVNFSTSGYNKSNINNYYNPAEQSKNITSSSVSYSQTFPDNPLSLTLNSSLMQRTSDSTISLTLPTLNLSLSRIYPFKRKHAVGKERFYEKISLSYTLQASNSISTKESQLMNSSFARDWRNGVKQTIPVSASFNLFNVINITPNFNYNERWYFQKVNQNWNTQAQEVVKDTTYGFYRVYDYNYGISANTKIYGFYTPWRKLFGNKIDRIRHVMTPSLSFSNSPSFGDAKYGFYKTYNKVIVDKNNSDKVTNERVTYSPFSNGMYGIPGQNQSRTLSFSVANNVEAKVRNDNDTTGENKFVKVSLIDNLTIGGGYNFAADSLNWSNFSGNIRLKFKKYSLSLSGSFNPYLYELNSSGSPVLVNKLRWNYGKFPRFMGTQTSFSYTLNNNTFKKKDAKNDKNSKDSDLNADNNENRSNLNDSTANSDEHAKDKQEAMDAEGYDKISIPWSLTFSYTPSYRQSGQFDYNAMEYMMKFTQSFNFSGNIAPTPGWKVSFNGTLDIAAQKLTTLTFSINRDLHCWNLNASFTPVNAVSSYKSFMITVGVKSSLLHDLKYQKNSDVSSNTEWF